MAVLVGSARHDENKKTKGGKAGDQTGHEVETQAWYRHSKGWVVIRAKSAEVREKIAQDMEYACANPHIGYDQSQNGTLYNIAKKYGFDCSKVKENCETDCSRLVRVCVAYAGISTPAFYTGNEVEVLKATGQFNILTDDKYCTKSAYLLRGDILCTKTTGHTVVVLSDGAKIGRRTLRRNCKGDDVKELQSALNALGYTDKDGDKLVVDGTFGGHTLSALKKMQEANGLKVDGICGDKTWACIDALMKGTEVEVTTRLNCREGAGKSYPVKRVLAQGSRYHASTRSGEWIYLVEPKGWVMEKYVTVV